LIGAQIDLSGLVKDEASSPQPSPPEEEREKKSGHRVDALLFGESQARVVISVAALNAVKVIAQAKILGVPAARIGAVGGNTLQIKYTEGTLECDTRELHDTWWNSIARAMH
jgi:phosphoribosylformylglycinamidine synthase